MMKPTTRPHRQLAIFPALFEPRTTGTSPRCTLQEQVRVLPEMAGGGGARCHGLDVFDLRLLDRSEDIACPLLN